MVFSSILFLIYFLPIFFIGYFLIPNKYKNYWLLLSSILFYAWGALSFLPLLIISCFVDYISARNFKNRHKKSILVIAILQNVLLLLYFKYSNFFIDNLNTIIGHDIEWTKVILPIGISFLTFQKISYLVDVYRNDCEPQPKFSNYLLFITLFPQLIAGPIVRYKEISAQFLDRFSSITIENIYIGLKIFVIGLTKKVLLANTFGEQANLIFNQEASVLNTTAAWVGALAYTFQIYFDFSGYSDMAIGLGRMMGFTIPENFKFPYSSKSITEFWKRWHITLGSWMKDYLYIPLGGNKNGVYRTYLNLFVVFLISGFWHGASWNFIVWGAFHGFFLVIERLFLSNILNKLYKPVQILYSFIVVTIGWMFFRIDTFADAIDYIKSMFANIPFDRSFITGLDNRLIFMTIVALLFSFKSEKMQDKLNAFIYSVSNRIYIRYTTNVLMLFLYLICLAEIFATGFNPFIYFKF